MKVLTRPQGSWCLSVFFFLLSVMRQTLGKPWSAGQI